jgi:hypothetical protein
MCAVPFSKTQALKLSMTDIKRKLFKKLFQEGRLGLRDLKFN